MQAVCLDVFVSGRPSPSTPSILCLHCWGGAPDFFQQLMDALPTMHIIAPAFRQDLPEGRHSGYIELLTSDMMNLVLSRRLNSGAGFVVLGHGMGGKVAQALAAQRPPGLQGLILVSPKPLSPVSRSSHDAFSQMQTAQMSGPAEVALRTHLLAVDESWSQQVLQRLRAGAMTTGSGWTMHGQWEDLSPLAKQVRCPVIAIVGTMDILGAPESEVRELVLNKLTRAEGTGIVRVKEAAHLLPLEKPLKLAEIVRNFIETLHQ
ncbi:alpha/beta-hydrolase [Auricularia subglabra TFB-10046 SS5]|nr:alpha/beta-hydrolase [Auricularia subglabra TFB-10046 SS5]